MSSESKHFSGLPSWPRPVTSPWGRCLGSLAPYSLPHYSRQHFPFKWKSLWAPSLLRAFQWLFYLEYNTIGSHILQGQPQSPLQVLLLPIFSAHCHPGSSPWKTLGPPSTWLTPHLQVFGQRSVSQRHLSCLPHSTLKPLPSIPCPLPNLFLHSSHFFCTSFLWLL